MEFRWYIPVAGISIGFILIFLLIFCIIRYRQNKSKYRYNKYVNGDVTVKRKKVKKKLPKQQLFDTFYESNVGNQHITATHEKIAESALSDNDDVSVSAYGDVVSLDSRSSRYISSFIIQANINVQISLIYSHEMNYIAGKIIQVNGLKFEQTVNDRIPEFIKVHAVVLPIKRYAIKTNWYPITYNIARVEEYFKFKFKLPPSIEHTKLRLRIYGNTRKTSVLGKSKCLGECYVFLKEITRARGGLTVWKTLLRNVPEVINEKE